MDYWSMPVLPTAEVEIDHETYSSEGQGWVTDRSFFSHWTADATVVACDVSDYEGAQVVFDLNEAPPADLIERFDFVYNGSCLDNVFNPARALRNIASLVRPHGRLMLIEHGSPLNSAYVMYSPAWFFDYFAINGFTDCKIYMFMLDRWGDTWTAFRWHAFHSRDGRLVPTVQMDDRWRHAVLVAIAERGESSTVDRQPIQAFYREAHDGEDNPAEAAYREAHRRFEQRRVGQVRFRPVVPAIRSWPPKEVYRKLPWLQATGRPLVAKAEDRREQRRLLQRAESKTTPGWEFMGLF